MDHNSNLTDLKFLREEIDWIDREISRLLQKRMELVEQIGDHKKQKGLKIFDENRELKVIENALSVVENKKYSEIIKSCFINIMTVSKNLQEDITGLSVQKQFALLGKNISHSLSAKIHDLFFKKVGVSGTYEIMDTDSSKLEELMERMKQGRYIGFNVTIPYKIEIMRLLDTLSDEAQRIGSVNTVKLGAKSIGHNTDYHGFGRSLKHYGFDPQGKSCAILGSGGASRAVAAYLKDHGISRLAIVSRDKDEASLKFPGIQCINLNEFKAQGFNLVVNATPVGTWPDTGFSIISKEQLKGADYFIDLIYNPAETLLMKYAQEIGIPCNNGLYMLVAQAVCSQEIWLGTKYDEKIIDDIFIEISGIVKNNGE